MTERKCSAGSTQGPWGERMKEELAGIKESRNAQVISGVVVIIYGTVLAFSLAYNMLVAVGILVSFTVIGIIFLVMASDCARAYRDKLKEVKKNIKKDKQVKK